MQFVDVCYRLGRAVAPVAYIRNRAPASLCIHARRAWKQLHTLSICRRPEICRFSSSRVHTRCAGWEWFPSRLFTNNAELLVSRLSFFSANANAAVKFCECSRRGGSFHKMRRKKIDASLICTHAIAAVVFMFLTSCVLMSEIHSARGAHYRRAAPTFPPRSALTSLIKTFAVTVSSKNLRAECVCLMAVFIAGVKTIRGEVKCGRPCFNVH
jgi:uncharacterized membrane protein